MAVSVEVSSALHFIDSDRQLAEHLSATRSTTLLAFDTEFERTVTYYPRPALLQVDVGSGLLLVDLLSVGDLTPLFERIADPTVTKLVHAGSEDMEILFALWAPVPEPLFDTQIAAGLAGVGFSLGYASLVAQVLGTEVPKDQSRSNWLARPLSEAQLVYAAHDVLWLRELHDRLAETLRAAGRLGWLEEECRRVSAAACLEPDPANAWQRIRAARALSGRSHAILRELADWREREARTRNRPRNHVLDESVLLALAERLPSRPRDLQGIPGLSAAEIRRSGDTLCALVDQARENELDAPSPIATRVAGHALKRLKATVRRVAQPLGIEPALLAPNRVLEALLLNVASGESQPLPEELRGWRHELLGEALLVCAEQEWSKRGNTT